MILIAYILAVVLTWLNRIIAVSETLFSLVHMLEFKNMCQIVAFYLSSNSTLSENWAFHG